MSLIVRRLEPGEWPLAFPAIAQLRSGITIESFLDAVRSQSESGYILAAAIADDGVIGVLGMRPIRTLARGHHMQVDDVVVMAQHRRSGAGRALMEFAEAEARARGMTALYLNARASAVPFYRGLGYEPHPVPVLKKHLR